MLMSTSLRGVTRRGARLCVFGAAHRAMSPKNGRWGRPSCLPWMRGCTVASSSKSSSSSSSSSSASSSSSSPRERVASTTLRVVSSNRHATDVLAAYFASASGLMPGDCYLLFGPVGAGKSHFSRAFIRYAMDDEDMEVPSPTYLLHNRYQRNEDIVHHYDLYRLSDAQEAEYTRLDLAGSFSSGVSLIEWPERLIEMGQVPMERLEMQISLGPILGDAADGMGRADRDEVGQNNELVRYETNTRGTEGYIAGGQGGDEYDTDEYDDDEEEEEEDDLAPERHIELRAYGSRFVDMVKTLGSHIEVNGAKMGLAAIHVC